MDKELVQKRANAKRRFTRTLRQLTAIRSKTNFSSKDLHEVWIAANNAKDSVNVAVENLRVCLEDNGNEVELDKLDKWCAEFDYECEALSDARYLLETLSISTVRSVSVVSEIDSQFSKVDSWLASLPEPSLSDTSEVHAYADQQPTSRSSTHAATFESDSTATITTKVQHRSGQHVTYADVHSREVLPPPPPTDRRSFVRTPIHGLTPKAASSVKQENTTLHSAYQGDSRTIHSPKLGAHVMNSSPYLQETARASVLPVAHQVASTPIVYGAPSITGPQPAKATITTSHPQYLGLANNTTQPAVQTSANGIPAHNPHALYNAPLTLADALTSDEFSVSSPATTFTSTTLHQPTSALPQHTHGFLAGPDQTLPHSGGAVWQNTVPMVHPGVTTESPGHQAFVTGDPARAPHQATTGNFQQAVQQAAVAAVQAVAQAQPANSFAGQDSSSGLAKLPKMELPSFDGTLLQWPHYWDMFRSMVHEHTSLSSVSKFTYLRGSLKGKALKAIEGLAVCNDNYVTAVQILEEKFGQREVLVNALYAKLQNLTPATSRFDDIRRTLESAENILQQLQNQGEQLSAQGSLCQQLLAKFPVEVACKLEEWKSDSHWSLPTLRESLKRYVNLQERGRQVANACTPSSKAPEQVQARTLPSTQQRPVTAEAVVAANASSLPSSQARSPCVFCNGSHLHDACKKFTTATARKQQLAAERRCFVCLRKGHSARECHGSASDRPCRHCHRKGHHHPVICTSNPCLQQHSSTPTGRSATSSNTVSASTISDVSSSKGERSEPQQHSILLQTATITATRQDGSPITFRALLDSGSQRSYMTRQLADALGVEELHPELLSVSTFGTKSPSHLQTTVAQFDLPLLDHDHLTMHVNVLDREITQPIGCCVMDQDDLDVVNHFDTPLADIITAADGNGRKPIDLLIGTDYYWNLINSERVVLPSGLFAISSRLGYIITGRSCTSSQTSLHNEVATLFINDIAHRHSAISLDADDSAVTNLWQLDAIGITDSPVISDDDAALALFQSTVTYTSGSESRYTVTLPWKSNDIHLPDNFGLSLGRLRALVKRFESDPDLLESYNRIFQQQLELGVIEPAPAATSALRPHYLPHHPVVTPQKSTTKVRIVYDASARAKRGNRSLNDCLYRGPVLIPNLAGMLMRFRLHAIVLLSDIEKAFLQISIHSDDRDSLRFLWYRDISQSFQDTENVQAYRFCRVPFGLVCSPFLLAATIHHHLRNAASPLATRILDNIYVDNVMLGCDTVEEALELYKEARSLFASASMNLREWASNSSEVHEKLPDEYCCTGKINKMLGLSWNIEKDTLQLPVLSIQHNTIPPSKRSVLKLVAAIFDPIGFFTPITFNARVFLQHLWSLQLTWDETLSPTLSEQWSAVVNSLMQISTLSVPRFIGFQSTQYSYQLIVFTDASAKSYAAVAYLRIIDHNTGMIKIHLAFSKMRLPPRQHGRKATSISLPRLELLGVLIGVRIVNFIRCELHLDTTKVTLWTDSACVLTWIKSSKPLPRFVENRVREIRTAENIEFRYVASQDNPADLPTRGREPADLRECSFWWNGPQWLLNDPSDWPTWKIPIVRPEDLDNIEDTETPAVTLSSVSAKTTLLRISGEKYSTLARLLRVTTYVLQFISRSVWAKLSCKTQEAIQKKDELFGMAMNSCCARDREPTQYRLAGMMWTRQVQQDNYPDVFIAIAANKQHALQTQLGISVDTHGILRCVGRLEHSDCNGKALLPRKHWYSKLIIMSVHARLLHDGPTHTLNDLRKHYWIPQGRAEVRSVLRRCTLCRRYEGKAFKLPKMPPLPRERVTQSSPFENIGLDYLGPLYVWNNGVSEKVWVCLFTCLAVRAIHLELVISMDTQHFLNCFRRFAARRGLPSVIYSDNAPQFHLAASTMTKLWEEVINDQSVKCFLQCEGIQWRFIPELSPWQGGVYERLVGMVKRALRKAIGRSRLNLEQLSTLLTEVESTINSRPLTHLPTDEDGVDVLVLTPSHFLSGNRKIGIPIASIPVATDSTDPVYLPPDTDSAIKLLETWKGHLNRLNQFWQHWISSYLPFLQENAARVHKHSKGQLATVPEIGMVVLIKDDGSPRCKWNFGKIVELPVSKSDGQVRVAKVLIPSGKILTRSVNHLYPLELPDLTDKSNVNSTSKSATGNGHVVEPVTSMNPERADDNNGIVATPSTRRPTRMAAEKAKARMAEWLSC